MATCSLLLLARSRNIIEGGWLRLSPLLIPMTDTTLLGSVDNPTPILIENRLRRVDGPNEKDLIFKSFQEIPDNFLQRLKDQAEAQRHNKPEMRRVASIPEGIVHAWAKQGFHLKEHTAQEIVARLQKEDLGAFITGQP